MNQALVVLPVPPLSADHDHERVPDVFCGCGQGALSGGVREQTTRERWLQVHALLDKGVGLLECARRLDVALNTVKRYARMKEPTGEKTAPRYKPTLVDPYREHLRARRAADPAVPVQQLFREIREQGYTGSLNLLYKYVTQGRIEGERPVTTPQR